MPRSTRRCVCKTLTHRPFRVVVFRRMQVLVFVGVLLMALVPLIVWRVSVVRVAYVQAQRFTNELRYHVDAAFRTLTQAAETAAAPNTTLKPAPAGRTSTPLGQPSNPDVHVSIKPKPSDATHSSRRAAPVTNRPVRGFRSDGGEITMFVAAAAKTPRGQPMIVQASQPLETVIGRLSRLGIRMRVESSSSGSPAGAAVVWRKGRPVPVARLALTDPTGQTVAYLVAERPFADGFYQAVLSTVLLLLAGLALILAFMAETAAKARRVSRMWGLLTETLDAIGRGQLTGALPPGACLESAKALEAVDRLRTQLREQKKLLNNTSKLQNYLAHTYEEEKLARALWHYARRLGIDAVEVFRVDSSRAHARRVYRGTRNGLPDAERLLAVPDDCAAYRQAAPWYVPDTRTEMTCETCVGGKDRSYYCVPLHGRGATIGVLRFVSRRPRFFNEQLRDIAETYAGMLATAMDNTYLFNELRQASLRDPLTGLHNRRFLEEYLAKRQAAMDRDPEPVGIIMLDIDHFKNFNDTYGHDAGDQALRAVGSVIQRHLRAGDVACRFGGEEIVIVAEKADVEQAAEIAERLRRAIEAEAIRLPQRIDALRLTVSAGVAGYPNHGTTLLDVLRAADVALYEAKRQGRNRVVIYEASMSRGDEQRGDQRPERAAA